MTQLHTAHESNLICQYIWYTVTWSVWIIYWDKEYKECGDINGIFNPFILLVTVIGHNMLPAVLLYYTTSFFIYCHYQYCFKSVFLKINIVI